MASSTHHLGTCPEHSTSDPQPTESESGGTRTRIQVRETLLYIICGEDQPLPGPFAKETELHKVKRPRAGSPKSVCSGLTASSHIPHLPSNIY